MRQLLRRFRAVSFFAVFFALLWGLLGFGVGLSKGLDAAGVRGFSIGSTAWLGGVQTAGWWAVAGAGSGLLFALLLAIRERRTSWRSLSRLRAAIWGALGAATFVSSWAVINHLILSNTATASRLAFFLVYFSVLGGASASLVLGVARNRKWHGVTNLLAKGSFLSAVTKGATRGGLMVDQLSPIPESVGTRGSDLRTDETDA